MTRRNPMDVNAILAAVGGSVIALSAVARLPAAAAELMRSCISLVQAVAELRDAVRRARGTRPGAVHEEPAEGKGGSSHHA
ncbi:hypothetical protein ACH4UM_38230 [Streptomyces sp. NPDC020801]|uniref:hypothetical protein n=1 Tax=unclassified Streptomyces TaxID=2593676 RepID=UPI003787D734